MLAAAAAAAPDVAVSPSASDAAPSVAETPQTPVVPPAGDAPAPARRLLAAGATFLILLLALLLLAAPPWAASGQGSGAALVPLYTPPSASHLRLGHNATAEVQAAEAALDLLVNGSCGPAAQQPPLTALQPANRRRWLLCMPASGLNDCLNQLYRCTRYAAQYGYGMLLQLEMYRAAELSDVLDLSGLPVPVISRDVDTALKGMFAKGTVKSTFPPQYDLIKKPRTQLLNNLTAPLPPGVLSVFSTSGGGCNSLAMLRQLRLAKPLRDEWLTIRRALPARYAALHVRNTDRHVNAPVEEFVAAMPPELPLVLATDDEASARLVQSLRPDVILSRAGRSHKTPNLHYMGHFNTRILPEAVLDLLLLAHAEVLEATTVWSGYSRLAFALRDNPDILRAFVGGTNTSL